MKLVQPKIRKLYLPNAGTIVLDSATTSKTFGPWDVSHYRKFLLAIEITWTTTPTNLKIEILFSGDGAAETTYVIGPFGSLYYVLAQGDIAECLSGDVISKYMSVYIVGTGLTGANAINFTHYLTFSD